MVFRFLVIRLVRERERERERKRERERERERERGRESVTYPEYRSFL